MTVRRLSEADAEAFRTLRLEGLKGNPTAFGSSYEESERRPLSDFAKRLEPSEHAATFGAFDKRSLVGVAGIHQELGAKEQHKAMLWGMYVTPVVRRGGVARALVSAVLDFARDLTEVKQVRLAVESTNLPALSLYTSFGFGEFGREKRALLVDGRYYDEVYMVLFLDAPASNSVAGASPPSPSER